MPIEIIQSFGRNSSSFFRPSYVLVPLVLGCHALALILLPEQAKAFSYAFLIAAPLLAALACLWRARRSGCAEGWVEGALAAFLWAGGMGIAMVSDVFATNIGPEAAAAMLLYVLYGVPLIFAVASPESELWYVRLVDGVLALTLGCLFFVHTFTFTTLHGTIDDGFFHLRLMFDIENAFIALFALVRFLSSRDGSRRAFFGTLSLFSCAYMVSAAYINHFQSDADFGGLSDLVICLPFLLLGAAALGARPLHPGQAGASPVWRRPSQEFARLVRAGSPLALPATLLAVAGVLVPHRPGLAIAGFTTAVLGYGLRNVLVQVRGFQEQDRLSELTMTDQLTGLPNRRSFDETLRREWNRARRSGQGLGILMIDIDHFKQLNDTFGHPVGDLRLQEVGTALAKCATRADEFVARYGGEEFVAVLPVSDRMAALEVAERMREAVAGRKLDAPNGIVTISVGMGWTGCVDGEEPADLLAAADTALYEAKRSGRNCVRQGDIGGPAPLRAVG